MHYVTDDEDVWKIVDEYIEQNREANESIQSMGGCGEDGVVRIKYARISDNKLITKETDIKMRLLNLLHKETILLILKEVFEYLRKPVD